MNEAMVFVSFLGGALLGGGFNWQFVRDLRQNNIILRQRLEVVEQRLHLIQDENLKFRAMNYRLEVEVEQLISRIGALESELTDLKAQQNADQNPTG